MRRTFAAELYKQMTQNEDIWLVTGDLGYGMWDKIKDDFPDRFLNTGAAEHAMMDIAVGLALSGKIPFVYSITPFLLYRPFEVLRTYINHEKIPVKLVGSGRDKDYAHDGISHWAEDAKKLFTPHNSHVTRESQVGILNNIHHLWPEDKEDIPQAVQMMVETNKPMFISLKR